ncbi:hypothetical protein PG990_005445 [Apiospora arundinis]
MALQPPLLHLADPPLACSGSDAAVREQSKRRAEIVRQYEPTLPGRSRISCEVSGVVGFSYREKKTLVRLTAPNVRGRVRNEGDNCSSSHYSPTRLERSTRFARGREGKPHGGPAEQ